MRITGNEVVTIAKEPARIQVVSHLTAAELSRADARWLSAQSALRDIAPLDPAFSLDWRWSRQDRSDGRCATVGLWKDDGAEALATYSVSRRSHLPENDGHPCLKLEYLASAPWNRGRALRAIGREAKVEGAGLAMVRAVVRTSVAKGFGGRVRVMPICGTEAFYHDVCGMIHTVVFDPQNGPTDWYELTAERAASLLGESS